MEQIDTSVFLLLNGNQGHFADSIFWILSAKTAFIPIGVLALWLIYKRYGVKQLLLAIGCIAFIILCADQGAGFFKHFTPRLRPTHQPLLEGMVHTVNGYVGGYYGTVSAHAANSFGVAIFSALIIQKRWFAVLIFIFSAAVAYSRIYLGVHYPMDILYGTILGLVIGYLFSRLFVSLSKKITK